MSQPLACGRRGGRCQRRNGHHKSLCLSLPSCGCFLSHSPAGSSAGCVLCLLLALGFVDCGWQLVASPSNQKPLSCFLSPVWIDGVCVCALSGEGQFVYCRKRHCVITFVFLCFPLEFGRRSRPLERGQDPILWRCCFPGGKVLQPLTCPSTV